MKQIKINITEQTRADLDFIRTTAGLANIGEAVEMAVAAEVARQEIAWKRTVELMPAFVYSHPPRKHLEGVQQTD